MTPRRPMLEITHIGPERATRIEIISAPSPRERVVKVCRWGGHVVITLTEGVPFTSVSRHPEDGWHPATTRLPEVEAIAAELQALFWPHAARL